MEDPATLRFVIREVTAASSVQVDEVVGTEAAVLTAMPTTDGQTVYCAQLAHPITHQIHPAQRDRYDPAYLAEDHTGTFAWTYFVTVHPHQPAAIHPGTIGVAAELAFVTDLTLSADAYFDPDKVLWAATVVIDAAATADAGAGQPAPAAPPATATDQDRPPQATATPAAPAPLGPAASQLLHHGDNNASSQQFAHALDAAISTAATLTGLPVDSIPRPQEVKPRKHSRHRGDGPSYSIGSEFRYHTADPAHGLIWKSTTDLDEALYWIVDDITRSIAITWAHRTPAAATMNDRQLQWTLAVPFWHTLMTALDPRWEPKTRARIAELRNHAGLGNPQRR
jgi:hypothetical protein